MTEAASGPLDTTHRSDHGCLCCGADGLYAEATITAPFLARRALQCTPEITPILFCGHCGFRFFDRGLTETESFRLYDGYRNEAYFTERNACEPFYTRSAHRRIAECASLPRRQAVVAALSKAGAPARFESVLDFGGGDGGLIADFPATERTVYDLSGAAPVDGVHQASAADMASRHWDLVVCAQVLEHVSDPRATLATLAGLLAPQGLLYLEVPDEIWSNRTFAGAARDGWLRWLVSKRRLLIAADTLSTACRILFGFLPPFGFIPMREHLQYFTTNALVALVRTSGLHVVRAGHNAVGQIYVVAGFASPTADTPAEP